MWLRWPKTRQGMPSDHIYSLYHRYNLYHQFIRSWYRNVRKHDLSLLGPHRPRWPKTRQGMINWLYSLYNQFIRSLYRNVRKRDFYHFWDKFQSADSSPGRGSGCGARVRCARARCARVRCARARCARAHRSSCGRGPGAQPPENFWEILLPRVHFYNRVHFLLLFLIHSKNCAL